MNDKMSWVWFYLSEIVWLVYPLAPLLRRKDKRAIFENALVPIVAYHTRE